MRQTLLLLVLAAAALAGCAGAPAPASAPPLTVEMSDLPAPPPSPPQDPALASPGVPAPAAPAAVAAVPSAVANPPVPVEVTPVAPAGAAQASAPVLSLPEAPSPQAASKPAAAALPKQQQRAVQAAPTPQASSAPSAAPSAPAAPAAQAAPAASAAPSAPPVKSPSPAGAAPQPPASSRVREIFARLGDELQIGLEGRSFLFLGFPDSGQQKDGMAFKGKVTKDSKSTFTFKALKLGQYDLEFLQQDNAAGRSVRETVRVHVVPDADFAAAIGGQGPAPSTDAGRAGGTGTAGEKGDYAHAEKLAGLGAREAALQEFLKGYEDGDGWLNDRIATLYFAGGDLDAAEKYWSRNLGLGGLAAEKGTLGMVRVALARDDRKGFISLLKPFLAVRELSIEEELVRAARLEQKAGVPGVGLDLALEYARRYPEGRYRDEAEWLAGQFYEADSPLRDFARAREVYRVLLSSWPESAFAPGARERVRWIEDHFFTVR